MNNRSLAALAALAALSLTALPAQAQRYTAISGGKLVQFCTSRDKLQMAECNTYIQGLSDAATFYQELMPRDGSKGARLPAYICVPASTTETQLREAVVAWAKQHAGDMQKQASGVVLRALRDTYRCQGQG